MREDVPAKTISHSKAIFATLAHIEVSKHNHYLPLYRLPEMITAQDTPVHRPTLAGDGPGGGGLLDPIYCHIREEDLKTAKIRGDSILALMLMPGKCKAVTARLWSYIVDDRASGMATARLVWGRITPDCSGTHPQCELETFSGLLQADGYAGCDKLYDGSRIAEVACWARFFKSHQASPTALATNPFERIKIRYKIKDKIHWQPHDERQQ